MPDYTQYFNIDSTLTVTTTCAAGTCDYFPSGLPLGLYFLGYGHRVTVTILASDLLPTRLGAYSDTSGEFAIDFNPPTVGASVSHNFPLADTYVEFEFQAPAGYNFNIRVDYDAAPGETSANDFCAYGTRIRPGFQNAAVITETAVAAAALLVPELAWAAVALGALVGLSWVPGNVCASPPPPIPRFQASDFVVGTDIPLPQTFTKLWQLWEALNWPIFCECIPASGTDPAPVAYPPPAYGLPPGTLAPPPGPIICDEQDLCASLNNIMRQLESIQSTVTLTRFDVQLIQRQGVPFGYVAGSIHSALTGSGDFDVADILGLAITLDVIPPTSPPLGGDPVTYHQLGKVSVGTADGWRRSWMPTHNPYLILPILGAFTRVGYAFSDGVVATITELRREP